MQARLAAIEAKLGESSTGQATKLQRHPRRDPTPLPNRPATAQPVNNRQPIFRYDTAQRGRQDACSRKPPTATPASSENSIQGGDSSSGRAGTENSISAAIWPFVISISCRPTNRRSDHLGRPIPIEPRNDFQFHSVMLFAQGWLFDPKFQYQTFVWTVQDTNQVAVGGALTYNFSKYFTLGAGWNAYPGTQSLQGSHPYWVSYDRVMADEFFRPYFSQGVFAQGIILPRLAVPVDGWKQQQQPRCAGHQARSRSFRRLCDHVAANHRRVRPSWRFRRLRDAMRSWPRGSIWLTRISPEERQAPSRHARQQHHPSPCG